MAKKKPIQERFNIWDVEDPEGAGMTEQDFIDMFQYLVDTGKVWKLQGWYGRTAQDLLDAGKIKYPKGRTHDYYGNPIPTQAEIKKRKK